MFSRVHMRFTGTRYFMGINGLDCGLPAHIWDSKMADAVDIDLYADDVDQEFNQVCFFSSI